MFTKGKLVIRCGMWDVGVGCGMWDVGCGMWDVGCGMWDVGWDVVWDGMSVDVVVMEWCVCRWLVFVMLK
jgi:hypothetical protein